MLALPDTCYDQKKSTICVSNERKNMGSSNSVIADN